MYNKSTSSTYDLVLELDRSILNVRINNYLEYDISLLEPANIIEDAISSYMMEKIGEQK